MFDFDIINIGQVDELYFVIIIFYFDRFDFEMIIINTFIMYIYYFIII